MNFIESFRHQRLSVICDDNTESFRAVLVAPAQDLSKDMVNRILHLTGGIVFTAISPTRAQAFLLDPASRPRMNPSAHSEERTGGTPPALLDMCESVEAREGVTTGISAADRSLTISILGEPTPVPRKLVKPGHVFPVLAKEGGVLVKNALPEGALDLARLAGFTDAAVFIDLLDSDGAMMNRAAVEELAKREGLSAVTLAELVRHRLTTERLVYRYAEARLPTHQAGELRSVIYKSTIHEGEHIALVKGDLTGTDPVLTRVQAEFTFGDVFGGNNPPTRSQIQRSLKAIGDQGRGILLYLRRPAAGQLRRQVGSWESEFRDRAISNIREYGLGAQILRDLGVHRVDLLTGSPVDTAGLAAFGIEIVSQRPIPA